MTGTMEAIEVGSKVFVKGLSVTGEVVRVCPGAVLYYYMVKVPNIPGLVGVPVSGVEASVTNGKEISQRIGRDAGIGEIRPTTIHRSEEGNENSG